MAAIAFLASPARGQTSPADRPLVRPATGSPAVVDAGREVVALVRLRHGLTPPPGIQQGRALRPWSAEVHQVVLAHAPGGPAELRYDAPVTEVRPAAAGYGLDYRVRIRVPAWVAPGRYTLRLVGPGLLVDEPDAIDVRLGGIAASEAPAVAQSRAVAAATTGPGSPAANEAIEVRCARSAPNAPGTPPEVVRLVLPAGPAWRVFRAGGPVSPRAVHSAFTPTGGAYPRAVLLDLPAEECAPAIVGSLPPAFVVTSDPSSALPHAPTFTLAPARPVVASPVRLAANAPRGAVEPIAFVWDLGDRDSARGRVIDHTFLGRGPFRVGLTLVDGHGRMATRFQEVRLELASSWSGACSIARAPRRLGNWTVLGLLGIVALLRWNTRRWNTRRGTRR